MLQKLKENMEFSNLVSKVLSLCVSTEIFASRNGYRVWLVNCLVVSMAVDTASAPCFKISLYAW